MAVIIVTPRPPLNLFEAVRVRIDDTWSTIYQVPKYEIPASGPTPATFVDAAAIMTGAFIANTISVAITVSARILNAAGDPYELFTGVQIPIGDYLAMDLNRQVMLTDETLQFQCSAGGAADVHFSFILNQREQFQVIV